MPSTREGAVRGFLRLDVEEQANLRGGRERGAAFDGLLHGGVTVDTGPLGLWVGGRLHVSAVRIWSGRPSRRYVGDLQVASNVAAPTATRLYSAWLRQELPGSTGELRMGIIDLNAYFVTTERASTLINSSFGITPSITANVPTAIYPEPGFGAMAAGSWGGGAGTARLGVFQGRPQERGSLLDGGGMGIGEVDFGPWKAGFWSYSGTGGTPAWDWGVYGIADAELGALGPARLGGFVQVGASPRAENPVPYYLGAGLEVKRPFTGRPEDRVAAGVARAWIRGAETPAETSWEVTYTFHCFGVFHLQPDLQYVVDPSGTLPNATVVTMRLHLELP